MVVGLGVKLVGIEVGLSVVSISTEGGDFEGACVGAIVGGLEDFMDVLVGVDVGQMVLGTNSLHIPHA